MSDCMPFGGLVVKKLLNGDEWAPVMFNFYEGKKSLAKLRFYVYALQKVAHMV